MSNSFTAAMRRALDSTRAYDLTEATASIQEALGQARSGAPHAAEQSRHAPRDAGGLCIDHEPRPAAPAEDPSPASAFHRTGGRTTRGSDGARTRKPLGEVLHILREGRARSGAFDSLPGLKRNHAPLAIPENAQFLARTFACAAGTRSYRLYIPASLPAKARGLVVMLHGCTQDPEDFARGTTMNALAEEHRLIIAYPGQTKSANTSSCWNWFDAAHQRRDAGEPSIIAGITRTLMDEFGLDRDRTFIAGLSAGGAMAATMIDAYPDLYAGAGIHSGLAARSANDVVSAFAAMGGDSLSSTSLTAHHAGARSRIIVFHGTADRTVHPRNGDRIIAAAGQASGTTRATANGRGYTRTVFCDADGVPAGEHWQLQGAGHAWSGGDASGSYADAAGPNASAEMVRFFLELP